MLFTFCLQSFPTLGSFQMSQVFPSGGQTIGALASTSVLPMNIQAWFPLEWTGLMSLQSRGLSRVLYSIPIWKHQFFRAQPSLWSNLAHPYMTTGKTIGLTTWTFVGKVMSLLFNMLSRLVIASFLRSKNLLILWLQSLSTGILDPKKIKSDSVSTFFPSICQEVMGPDDTILVFICNYLLCKINGLFKYTKYLGWKLL